MDKSYARRLALNSAIFKSPYWVLSVDDVGHENYMPVGRGVPSSPSCGKWFGVRVCDNEEGHKGLSLGGEDATGMVVVHNRHWFCNRSGCPVCFIKGYSVRRARAITSRLEEGERRGFGEIEHILVSVPVSDYGLEEDVLRKKCRAVLKNRGVVGASMVFHGYRVDDERGVLVWRPHYHAFGFIEGGYTKCRECPRKWNCLKGCGGFDDRAWQSFQRDGYFVKVFSRRKKSYYDGEKRNIFGTAFYQLNHATKRIGVKRFHIVTYFGVVGNRKFATPKVVSEVKCPLCGEEMVKSVYIGSRPFIKNVGHPDYKSVFLRQKFNEFGEPNFIEKG